MAEDPKPTEDPQEQTTNPAPEEEPEGDQPKGDPKGDDKIAAQKYREQRDKARSDLAELQKQLEAVKGDSEELAQLKAQVKEQQEALEKERETAQVTKLKAAALAQAGCQNVDDALTLWDMGTYEDVDDFKKAKPYLFKALQTGSTGAKPIGASDNLQDVNQARKRVGLPEKE